MAPQDSFIDEEDEVCPLCIEEFDLSDRNFRPCPCGYQICQFCFNNIRNNMNSLCPACRRPYDEKTIQWKVVTQEEIAEFRANIQKNQKKRAAEQRQREVQKREAEKENRKNLVGVRVVQKNLVYVTGLTPTVREDELLRTLRKPEFFGQYGNIQKISISNRKGSDGLNQSLGIYVTFEKKEDASRCIQAVNGSQNGDRVLRAQLGTTKYCSAWLRHEQCTNRQCMFLHELGDEEDSYTRQDLSSMNSISTQRPLPARSASRQQTHPSPAPHAAQPMARTSSKDGSDNGDGSALPSSANWARNPQVRSRRGSHATSGAAPSPAISNSLPVTAESAQEAIEEAPYEEHETPAGPSAEVVAAAPASRPPKTKIQKAKRIPQDALASLLKSLNSCTLSWPTADSDVSFPPLFDVRGGAKRRAMRNNEELSVTDDQEQSVEARDPSEGEPESSGSLALGGEPEDREHVRETHGFDLRRTAQPPIQRSPADGLFGPPLGSAIGSTFSQSTTNLGSIGSRTMTPQQTAQPAFIRPQSTFVEHLPQSASSQASLFQGQGHNRQGSRFSFANDGRDATSSTSVKLAANPRIMAQQSSMMPSSFHNQPGNQYYASSMPGPPPGLKSTGTPPSMFGQHGFNSTFGTASKDSNEILHLLNRGRSAGNQVHDAGKLDLADPSILQVRLQSQQQQHLQAQAQAQSGAGLGQGLFGGQSQDDDLLSFEAATTSVDALVSDEPIDASIRQPPGAFDSSRSATPSVPPGIGLPHGNLPSTVPQSSLIGAASVGPQASPVALPILPVKASAAISSTLAGKRAIVPPAPDAKKNIKALAVESGLSKDIAKAKSQAVLQEEDFPALNTPKLTQSATMPVLPKAMSAKSNAVGSKKPSEKVPDKGPEEEKPVAPPTKNITSPKAEQRSTDKKPVPGILNIAAATKAAQVRSIEASATTEKSGVDRDSAFPALPTPSTASVSSPLARVAPKTLRLVPTPKTEVPPTPSAGGAPLSAAPSVRSAATTAMRPETPVSELISDSASIFSASMSVSRTNSPPPTKVGSAPVRTTTKSQQRKQRKEASKKDTSTVVTQPAKLEPEVEIAPIIGRKKKQKKEKEKPSSLNATPTASRPETPLPQPPPAAPVKEVKEVKEESSTYRSTANETTMLTEESLPKKASDLKVKNAEGSKLDRSSNPSSSGSASLSLPTPAAVLEDLQKAGLAPANVDDLPFFKPPTGQGDKSRSDVGSAGARDILAGSSITPTKSMVTDEDQTSLLAGKPVRKIVDGARVLLTPNGDCVRNLTVEEEDRFLELQKRIAEAAASPAAFVSSRQEAGGGFSLLKGRAVPNGPPSYFPSAPGAYRSDPMNKIQREEAIYYINQYVLPRLNLNARDMSFPKAMSSWNPDARSTAASAAAANLGSLAPWMYGSGSPAHDGDAAAPELSYPGPVGAFSDGHQHHHHPGLAPYLEISTGNILNSPPPPATADELLASAASVSAKPGLNPGATGPFGNVPLMSLEDAEQALTLARRETEKLDKQLAQFIKKNRRLLTMHGGH